MSYCGSALYFPVYEVNFLVPLFIVLGLVLFSCCYLARFPSLSAGSEFEFRRRWSLLVWRSGP